jgi:hypothetical protein
MIRVQVSWALVTHAYNPSLLRRQRLGKSGFKAKERKGGRERRRKEGRKERKKELPLEESGKALELTFEK